MNEIITCGVKYELVPGIKVFVQTAKHVCDKLTIINLDMSDDTISYLKDQNVNIVEASDFIAKYNVNIKLSPYTLKVIFNYLYSKHVCNATNIFVSDITDVCFQHNPFSLIKNKKPYVSTENMLFKHCKTNTAWAVHCYNNDINSLLMDYAIINSGLVFGERNGVVDLLSDVLLECKLIIERVGNYPIIDQIAFNKTIYLNNQSVNFISDNSLLNMANCKLPLSKKTVFALETNTPVVLHQYNRNSEISNDLYERYSK